MRNRVAVLVVGSILSLAAFAQAQEKVTLENKPPENVQLMAAAIPPEYTLLAASDPEPQQRGAARASGPHSVLLSWTASTDAPATLPSGAGYNIYESSAACPATQPTNLPVSGFSKLNPALVTTTTFTDSGMGPGTRCYFSTFTLSGAESGPSNTATALVLPASPGSFNANTTN